jgi:hypothetical protein
MLPLQQLQSSDAAPHAACMWIALVEQRVYRSQAEELALLGRPSSGHVGASC